MYFEISKLVKNDDRRSNIFQKFKFEFLPYGDAFASNLIIVQTLKIDESEIKYELNKKAAVEL